MAYDFDLFVIGGGSAGVRCARIAATSMAPGSGIAEERFWGGTCVNVGCVPKKIMVNAAEYGQWAEDAAAFGWTIEKAGLRPCPSWRRARDAEVARLNGIYGRLLAGAGCHQLRCPRQLRRRAHIGRRRASRVTAEKIIIAVGGRAVRPGIPGDELGMLSDDVFDLKQVPRRLTVVGSGYIALEFACVFRGLGAEVDLVYRADLPLRGFDHDIRVALEGGAGRPGHPPACRPPPGPAGPPGRPSAAERCWAGRRIEADAVLFATGRDAEYAWA